MDRILDMNSFLSSVFFSLLPNDVAWDNIILSCSCQVITLAYCFGKMTSVTAIMGDISL